MEVERKASMGSALLIALVVALLVMTAIPIDLAQVPPLKLSPPIKAPLLIKLSPPIRPPPIMKPIIIPMI